MQPSHKYITLGIVYFNKQSVCANYLIAKWS